MENHTHTENENEKDSVVGNLADRLRTQARLVKAQLEARAPRAKERLVTVQGAVRGAVNDAIGKVRVGLDSAVRKWKGEGTAAPPTAEGGEPPKSDG